MTNRNYFATNSLLGSGRAPCAVNRVPLSKKNQAAKARRNVASNQRIVTSRGFSLLEVMVAMSVMAIVLVSVYRMHSQTLSMNIASRFYTLAPMLGQSKLSELETSTSELTTGDSGDFGDKYPGYTWSVSVEEMAIEALGEVANDFKQIDLTVSLNSNEFSYNIRTYRLMDDR